MLNGEIPGRSGHGETIVAHEPPRAGCAAADVRGVPGGQRRARRAGRRAGRHGRAAARRHAPRRAPPPSAGLI